MNLRDYWTLPDHYETTAKYWMDAARESAQEGLVENVGEYLDNAEDAINRLSITKSAVRLMISTQEEKPRIWFTAYVNGLLRHSGFVAALAEKARLYDRGRDKELDVLLAYNSLEKVRIFGAELGFDIGTHLEELQQELNDLGLKEFLGR